jgi:hypothetical protein
MYGYDSGYKDPRVVLEVGKTPTDVFVVLDHFHREESQPEDVIDPNDGSGWLSAKPEGTIYSEHVPEHVDKFRRAGWPVQEAIKDVDDGINYVQGRLQDDGEHGPGLLVSEACGQLIREFMSYQEDEIGTSGATDHCADALRYALYTDEYGGTEVKRTTVTPSGSSESRSSRNRKPGRRRNSSQRR